jgi:hypothetical protein
LGELFAQAIVILSKPLKRSRRKGSPKIPHKVTATWLTVNKIFIKKIKNHLPQLFRTGYGFLALFMEPINRHWQ